MTKKGEILDSKQFVGGFKRHKSLFIFDREYDIVWPISKLGRKRVKTESLGESGFRNEPAYEKTAV